MPTPYAGSERGQFQHGSEVTPGHEAAGIVAAAGPDTHTPVGTHGVVFLMGYCGACRSCRLGYTNQCLDKRADMGFNRDGGYGPYELVDESIFFPIDPDIAPTDATLLLDIMGTGGHALRRGSLVHPDIESVLIAGAGSYRPRRPRDGPYHVRPDRPGVYQRHRAPIAWHSRSDSEVSPIDLRAGSLDAGLARHNAVRVDIAVDTSGRAAARKACLDALAQRGVLVCVGHGEGLELSVSPDLIGPERTVMGSEYFRYDEMPGNLELFRQHRDYLRQIITHHIAVADIQPAFETFFAGNTGKVVIEQ